jgi:uncharacterized protein (DUF1684 family)
VELALSSCARQSWPEPPAVDAAIYQKEHEAWRQQQQEGVGSTLAIVGIWPLAEGDNPFGSDASLPIVLPASAAPSNGGVIRREGEKVTVVPAPRTTVRLADGKAVTAPTEYADGMAIGSVSLIVEGMPGGRLFVTGIDQAHPALKQPPVVDAFPADARWRVAARFDPFDTPRTVKVPDVRGGTMDFTAAGQLVFRLADREWRLTTFDSGPDEPLFVMFKDQTNGTSTYGGYRIVTPKRVKPGEFTVLDFNLAMNPPCAYSPYTTCPLPPPENRLDVAVEAGLKRLPSVKGFTSS